MEDFTDHVTHLNTVNYAPQVWDQKDIKVWIPFSCVLTLTRYGKTGKKNKRATCFATLLQNRPSPYDSSTRPMSFRSRGSGCGSIMHWPRRPGKSRTGTRQMKSYVARFTTHVQTCLATNQVFASCGILTSDWLKLRGSHTIHGIYVTRCKTSLLWAGKTGNISCTDFAATWFVERQF